ncbi:MAG: hypothetical protein K0R69_3131 [Clostridia bacterium]|jgi:hypothetical protein|nr:hypothetical protein [Clostridia bacterium]
MRRLITVDVNKNIVRLITTFDDNEEGVELTVSEYEKAKLYTKFNSEDREFWELKTGDLQSNQDDLWKAQIEGAIGTLAVQVAKNTLLQGGNL